MFDWKKHMEFLDKQVSNSSPSCLKGLRCRFPWRCHDVDPVQPADSGLSDLCLAVLQFLITNEEN